MPHPNGDDDRGDPGEEQQRPRPDATVGFVADLEEAIGAGEQPEVAVDEIEVAQQDVAAHAPADHVLGRRREVVDQLAEVARIVTDLVDQRRQPEHREQTAGPGEGSDERSAIVAAPAADEHDGDGEHAEAPRHEQVRDVGLGGERCRDDERDEHHVVAAQRPTRSRAARRSRRSAAGTGSTAGSAPTSP